MVKIRRNKVSFKKLCSYEKAIVRSICFLAAILVSGIVFSGFCCVDGSNDESEHVRSANIDFAASAENTAIFTTTYNTLQTGAAVDNTFIADGDVNAIIGDVVEDMYSAAVSINLQKAAMLEDDGELENILPDEAEASTDSSNEETTVSVPETERPPEKTEPQTNAPETQPEIWAPESTAAATETEYSFISASSVSTVSVKTPPATLMLDKNGVPVNCKKVITGSASAYAGDGSTATGTKPVPGSVAVDPRIIPYGTEMWIVSSDGKYVYGYAVAEDTGGFVHWSNAPVADLFFSSEAECVSFGRRDITIYILGD